MAGSGHDAASSRTYFHIQLAAHRLRTIADERCRAVAGVTAAQAAALYLIAETPGITQRAIAQALRQREPAITGMVDRLSAAGLAERRPHPVDGRAWEVRLTAAGARALEAVDTDREELNRMITMVVGTDYLDQFSSTVEALSRLELGSEQRQPR